MGFKMRSGNGPLPFKQMGSSPAKHGTGKRHEHREHGKEPQYHGAEGEVVDAKQFKKEGRKEKTAEIDAKEIAASKKVKGAIVKGAKAVGKVAKKGIDAARKATMMTKEDIAQRKEEKPHSLKEQIRATDDPKERLKLRKQRRNKIADSLEYLFLDGERPDVKQAKKEAAEAKEARADARFEKLYGDDQNKHTGYTDKTKRKPMYDTDTNLFKEFDPVTGEFKDKA